MKLLELVAPPDDKALYRKIAQMAIDGDKQPEKKAAALQLYETHREETDSETGKETRVAIAAPSKDDIAKVVATLRSRLASVDMGRFSVAHNGGQIAYVTVNDGPVRKRAAKKTAPAPKKDAAPKVK
jgi:hypothetical protein